MASLHIEKEYDDMLNELKTIHEMDKKKIVQLCIRYIYKNKINPENVKPADSAAELKALRNTIVGFMKTQEKEKLEPILLKLDYIIEKSNKVSSSPGNTSSQSSDQYSKLLDIHKNLGEQYKKLGELYNNSLPIISKQLKENTEFIANLNVTVENKLSKRIL